MLDRYLIDHCSPTLASLKTASLFWYSYTCRRELQETIAVWNRRFQKKGLFLLVLQETGEQALIYICRHSHLKKDLQKPGVSRFLSSYGYRETTVGALLARLKMRLAESEVFPHEIGIFLGYPLGDVIGFIKNSGQNCKCSGCWKVYCNQCEAMKTFARYKRCRDIYARLWGQGKTVLQLTVAVQ